MAGRSGAREGTKKASELGTGTKKAGMVGRASSALILGALALTTAKSASAQSGEEQGAPKILSVDERIALGNKARPLTPDEQRLCEAESRAIARTRREHAAAFTLDVAAAADRRLPVYATHRPNG